jgi:hypothetical protein
MSALDSETAMRAVQLEAPYLIHILDNVMTSINTHQTLIGFRSASSPSSSSKDGSNSNSSCSNAFAKQVKEKLQNALLKGVFGGDNQTFRNCLQLPLVPENGTDETPSSQVDPAEMTLEWFMGEVWRILGWDILAGDGAGLL